ncbi:MAG TPA: ATP-binding cassette domain-containing protein, partial [Anaerolineae bacterium]|nr:ATP-binding cassette domain-containing protein [Anaerolineae bacterium]
MACSRDIICSPKVIVLILYMTGHIIPQEGTAVKSNMPIPQTVPAEVKAHISIAGLDPQRQSVAQLAARVGLVFQNPATQLFNGTVEEEIAFGPRNLNLPAEEIAARLEYALEAAGCARLRRRAVRHLSGGEQQRVAIAATLITAAAAGLA